MENKLPYGKDAIGCTVYDVDGNAGIITDMYTVNGCKCMVDIIYSDGTKQTREKYWVSKGSFKKPILMDEQVDKDAGFVPVYGWEGYYVINKDGIIKSVFGRRKGTTRTPTNSYKYSSYKKESVYENPYKYISLYRGGKATRCHVPVHRLVIETFIRPLMDGEEINHINGISSDNRLINLEITSRLLNNRKYFSYDFLCSDELKILEDYCKVNNLNLKEGLHLVVKEGLKQITPLV